MLLCKQSTGGCQSGGVLWAPVPQSQAARPASRGASLAAQTPWRGFPRRSPDRTGPKNSASLRPSAVPCPDTPESNTVTPLSAVHPQLVQVTDACAKMASIGHAPLHEAGCDHHLCRPQLIQRMPGQSRRLQQRGSERLYSLSSSGVGNGLIEHLIREDPRADTGGRGNNGIDFCLRQDGSHRVVWVGHCTAAV